jgi:phage shock protein A
MGVMDRASQLMTSDIDRLIGEADEPGAAIERLLGEIEASIVDLRREMVIAVARQNRLRQQLFQAEERAGRVEREASLALARGDELRARHLLGREIGVLKTRDALDVELVEAGTASGRLVAALIRMEDQAQLARRTRSERLRRLRTCATPEAGRIVRIRSEKGTAFDAYAEAVQNLEREASRSGGPEGGAGC